MKSYKDLLVWQKSFNLVIAIYTVLKLMPKDEMFRLTSQIKRCSVSVSSNIAEGWGRATDKSFINFLRIAKGSLFEMETQLLIVKELKMVSIEDSIFNSIDGNWKNDKWINKKYR